MKIDKATVLRLIEQHAPQQVDGAKAELPDEIDTEDGGHRGLLSKFGVDVDQIEGLLGKLPGGLGGKLGKLL